MERLEQLIDKLKEQFDKRLPHAQMLVTVKQIEAELSQNANKPGTSYGTAKVAVVMPLSIKKTIVGHEEFVLTHIETRKADLENAITEPKKAEEEKWAFDPLTEIPTLAQQQQGKEINDLIGDSVQSLNDRLKTGETDLGAAINGSPVHDLKKAIGINDRYVFINELFRGDEAMYERSIKTINNFRILPEAEYWMQRELKLKLGWDATKDPARHFFQLVKRRFS